MAFDRLAISAVALLLSGAYLLFTWWRPRRSGDEPVCRNCDYNLTGSLGTADRCPECGAALKPKNIAVGARASSPWRGCAWLILILTVGTTSYRIVRIASWSPTILPFGWIVTLLSGSDRQRFDSLAAELRSRLETGEVLQEQAAVLAEECIAIQSSAPDLITPNGELFQALYQLDLLTDEHLNRFVPNACRLELIVPPLASAGDFIPLRMLFDRNHVFLRANWRRVRVDRNDVEFSSVQWICVPMRGKSIIEAGGIRLAKPGEHLIEAEVMLTLRSEGWRAGTADGRRHTVARTLEARIKVLGEREFLQAVRLAQSDCVALRAFHSNANGTTWAELTVTRPPVDMKLIISRARRNSRHRLAERKVTAGLSRTFKLKYSTGRSAPDAIDLVVRVESDLATRELRFSSIPVLPASADHAPPTNDPREDGRVRVAQPVVWDSGEHP